MNRVVMMVGLAIMLCIIAAGITLDTAHATRTNDAACAALTKAASKQAGKPVSLRQARFQLRAIEHGMPFTHAAHECTRAHGNALVVAAALDGSGHGVFIDGKPATCRMQGKQRVFEAGTGIDYATKAAACAAYYIARDCDYVIHNAQCTGAHVAARQAMLDGRTGGHTGKVARQSMPAAKAAAMRGHK